jgi:hypothetical protein
MRQGKQDGGDRRLGVLGRALTVAMLTLVTAAGPAAAESEEPEPVDPARRASAIESGLAFLATRQVPEGLDGAGSFPGGRYTTAVTALAGLSYLAHGYMPDDEEYGPVITAALRYVMEQQSPDGYVGGSEPMYAHAIACLFAFSYLGMAEDSQIEAELAEWCGRALEPIINAQNVRKRSFDQGGWRYRPFAAESDLSVTTWQMLTLHAAVQCGYEVDPRVFSRGLGYMETAWLEAEEEGEPGGYVYRPGVSQEPKPTVTGAVVAIRSLIEPERTERLDESMDYVRKFPTSWGGTHYHGYFYTGQWYLAQGYLQRGEDAWRGFSEATDRLLLAEQNGDGSWPFPADARPQVTQTGASFSTAMSLLLLGIDNQYLPMYQRQTSLFTPE